MKRPISIVMALFLSALAISQEKCDTPNEVVEDLNSISITKCSIDDVKEALEDDDVKQISVRKHVRKSKQNSISINANDKVQEIKDNTLLVQKLNLKNDVISSLKKVPFHVVEQIPLFTKCENVPLLEQSKCFEQQMLRHIIRNFNYPKEAIKENIEGKVLVQFTINKEGKVIDIRKKGPVNGALLEKEAERLIAKLPKFIPGKHNGNSVNVKYALPITFKTPKEGTENEKATSSKNEKVANNTSSAPQIPFHLVEEIPLFTKCVNKSFNEKTSCFEQEMINHITLNFSYPKEAIQNGIQGKVLVKFTIDEKGNIINLVKKGPANGELLEQEAERLISSLPRFIPGKHNGKNVMVKYALPIIFRSPKKK